MNSRRNCLFWVLGIASGVWSMAAVDSARDGVWVAAAINGTLAVVVMVVTDRLLLKFHREDRGAIHDQA